MRKCVWIAWGLVVEWVETRLLVASSLRKACISLVFLSLHGVAFSHHLPTNDIAHFSHITLTQNHLLLRFTVAMTKTSALQELKLMNRNKDDRITEEEKRLYVQELGEKFSKLLILTLDGKKLELRFTGQVVLSKPPRYEKTFTFTAELPALEKGREYELVFEDNVYADVPGPSSYSVENSSGIEVTYTGSAEEESMLDNPFATLPPAQQKRGYTVVFMLAGGGKEAVRAPKPSAPPLPGSARGKLAEKVRALTLKVEEQLKLGKLGRGVVLVFLLVAFVAGAVHGLIPGHGKTLVGAYLIGTRGTWFDAVLLGLIVTFTHTISVIALGLVLYFGLRNAPSISPWLETGSGVIIFGLGLYLLIHRASHHHYHGHEHHEDDKPITLVSLLSIGVSGGVVPCMEAIAVLLTAYALNKTLFGLVFVLAFSLGVAVILISIGLIMVWGRGWLDRFIGERHPRVLPIISALIVTVLGLVITAKGLMNAGILIIRLPGS